MAICGSFDMKLVTPALQIVSSDNKGSKSKQLTTRTRKGTFFLKKRDGSLEIVDIPFFSAESIRGMVRRATAKEVMRRIIENSNGKKFSPKTVHMFIDGGLTSLSKGLTFDLWSEWREKFPFAYIFGVGLALPGKLVIQDALPIIDKEYVHLSECNDECIAKVKQIRRTTISGTKDDILNRESYIYDFISLEDVKKWEDEATQVAQERTEATKKNIEEKESKLSSQSWQEIEYVAPGSEFRSEITVSDNDLTNAEIGGIVVVFSKLAEIRRIGANQRKNWGLFNFNGKLTAEINGEKLTATAVRKVSNAFLNDDEQFGVDIAKFADFVDEFWSAIDKLTVDDVEQFRELMEKEDKK